MNVCFPRMSLSKRSIQSHTAYTPSSMRCLCGKKHDRTVPCLAGYRNVDIHRSAPIVNKPKVHKFTHFVKKDSYPFGGIESKVDRGSILKDSYGGISTESNVRAKDRVFELRGLEQSLKKEVRGRVNAELRQKELEIENQKLKDEVFLLKSSVMVTDVISSVYSHTVTNTERENWEVCFGPRADSELTVFRSGDPCANHLCHLGTKRIAVES